jgi:aryl-alcohol dehydrogenase-like predicted oxidoreductase
VDGCLERLQLEKLDLVLLHCPPTPVFSNDEVFAVMDKMKKAGKILNYGVSIEKVSEGLAAMKYDISAIEVIDNMVRMKPEKELFPAAKANNVGILARVPLASGILTGKFRKDTVFGPKDHRTFNRNGESFDKGETFSGVPYELGLRFAEELKRIFRTDDLGPVAIRWILMFPAVSTVIPGASKAIQVAENVKAAELEPLTEEQMQKVRGLYDELLRETIHPQW